MYPGQQQAALAGVVSWYLHSAHAAVHAAQSLFHPPPPGPLDQAVAPTAFRDSSSAMDWFAAERANLSAAARTALAAGLEHAAWKLAATVFPLHLAHGTLDDHLEMAELGLSAARGLDDPAALAAMWQTIALGHRAAGRLSEAADEHHNALRLYGELGDREGAVQAGVCLGVVHFDRRELAAAAQCFERALADTGDQAASSPWSTTALMNLAGTRLEAGHLAAAADLAHRALERARREEIEPRLRLEPMLVLARVHRESGELQRAEAQLREAAAVIADGVVYRSVEHAVLLEQAALAVARGEGERALEISWQCAALARDLHDRRREARSLDAIGQALLALGRAAEAADFHRAAADTARTHANPVETSTILAHLLDALRRSDPPDHDGASRARGEALGLLGEASDPRATALRENLHSLSR
jgi:tetratricopeptide (TPR) repeat protein